MKSAKNVRHIIPKCCANCKQYLTQRLNPSDMELWEGCKREDGPRWYVKELELFPEQYYNVCDRFEKK